MVHTIEIAVVEDDPVQADYLQQLITRVASGMNFGVSIQIFLSGPSFLAAYQKQFDIIFLDHRMPELSGFETALEIRRIDNSVVLVFVTAYLEHWRDGYIVSASDYLHKPASESELCACFKRIVNRVQFNHAFITLPIPGGKQRVKIINIVRTYHEQRKSILQLFDPDKRKSTFLTSSITTGSLANYLIPHSFIRVYNSDVVNPAYIVKVQGSYENKELVLRDGTIVQIAKSRTKEVLNQLSDLSTNTYW